MSKNVVDTTFDVSQEKRWTKNRGLRNSSMNWIFLRRLTIQNHSKLSITEKRQNKAKYLTWNSIGLKFVKKTSIPNPVKSLKCIKCYSSSSPRPIKSPSNSTRYNCQKIWSWSRTPKTIQETWKKGHISLGDKQTYYLQVFQRLY